MVDSDELGVSGKAAGERITVALTPRASRALVSVCAAEALSKTDVVSRALELYGLLSNFRSVTDVDGPGVWVRSVGGGPLERVWLV